MTGALRYALFIVLGLGAGLPLGFGLGHRLFDRDTRTLSDILALAEYETLAGAQYKQADIPHAKDALLDLLRFMNQMETNHRVEIQKAIDLDRGVTYMRLALLDEKSGNVQQAQDYIGKAQESMKKRDGKDVPEDKLRELVTKFDSTPQYKLPGVFLLSRGVTGADVASSHCSGGGETVDCSVGAQERRAGGWPQFA